MELILIRHALPVRAENADGRPVDPCLAPEGREQAQRLSRWLAGDGIDALYASPLRRARETAEPLARRLGQPLRVEAGLAEIDRASPSYVPLEELRAEDPDAWRAFARDPYPDLDLPGFQRQVIGACEAIVAAHPGGRVGAVCHGGVINAWASHVLGLPMRLFFTPDYTGICRFLAARSGARGIASLNETAHLR